IVPHTDPIQAGKFEWFMLDPTPADEGTVVEPNASLWSNARTEGQKFFSEYIVGLNPQSQKKAVKAVSRFMFSVGPWLVLFVAGAGLLSYARRVWRRRQAADAARPEASLAPWYTDLEAAFTARGLPRAIGQTPAEYALDLQNWLLNEPRWNKYAHLPVAAAEALYELRYRQQLPDVAELAELQKQIDGFLGALATLPAEVPS
ncbi:MAG: hypothetical protein ACRCZF_05130, partial [Gemmataceae bacterium]